MSVAPPASTCIVTGGTAGVGLATASRFATAGYRVAICGRNRERLAAAENHLNSLNPDSSCLAIPCDLADPGAAMEFADKVLATASPVSVLVNNAALAPLAPFGSYSESVLDSTLMTNVRSVFDLTQRIWPAMVAAQNGVIVNLSSQAAVDPFTGFSLYGASKAWIELMTVALADEGKEQGIRAYAIRPGAIETGMLRGLFPDYPAEDCVSPEQVANAIWDCVHPTTAPPSGSILPISNQS